MTNETDGRIPFVEARKKGRQNLDRQQIISQNIADFHALRSIASLWLNCAPLNELVDATL